jgi:hypothetical protein
MSCFVAVEGGGTSLGDVMPPGLDIWWRVHRTGTCVSGNGTPGRGSREPRLVPIRVLRSGRNRRPLVPWVQDPNGSP